MPPTIDEVTAAVSEVRNGKAPGSDGIPAEIYKHEGDALLHCLHALFKVVWQDEEAPQEFKDAAIVPIYKKKETGPIAGTIVASRYYPLLGKFYQEPCSLGYLKLSQTMSYQRHSADFGRIAERTI